MAKIQIKSETRHELSFFPNSFDDYVPKDSKVRMVDRIVRSMDINPLMDTYDGIGAPPYSPKMLLSLVVFAYINGVYSCRGIADALKYDVRYMWICGGKRLSFATINRFRTNQYTKLLPLQGAELKQQKRGCVISLWRTLFYVIYCIILEVS